jgi:hypothetical protein
MSENDSSRFGRDPERQSKNQTTIRRLFRSVFKALAEPGEDRPVVRRRKGGDKQGTFRKLSHCLSHIVGRKQPAARGRYAALHRAKEMAAPDDLPGVPEEFLYADAEWNALDMTNPWYDHGGGFESGAACEGNFDAQNYTCPRL